MSYTTKYLFNNAKFRSDLINKILDGTIQIDQNACNCIYRIEKKLMKKNYILLMSVREGNRSPAIMQQH